MQPSCPRCGRPLAGSSGMSAPGATPQPSCACGDAVALHASAAGGGGKRSREVDPLEAPSAGSVEIDPWSVPPPADGYENLVLDDGNRPDADAPADASEAVTPAPEAEAAPPPDRDASPERIARPARPGSRAILAVAGVAAALVAAAAAWLVLGDSRGGARPVRVRVTEEVASFAAPPLAPIDPTFVERRRPVETEAPAPLRAPAAAPPPRTTASRGRASVPPQVVAPPPAPVHEVREEPAATAEPAAPGPEPVPAKAPAALDASAIPLPPPPVPASVPPPVAATREAASASRRGRAPALQTRSCVEDALHVPRGLEDRLPAEVVLTVTVGIDGRAGDVSVGGAVDSRLASALAAAVRTCRFTPGADASGQPAAAPATMRLRFEP